MQPGRIEILLHPELASAARRLATERDISVGQLLRDLLAREINRARQARPPIRADERLVAPLRARLAPDLAEARSWEELDRRLKAKGYVLRAAGGGLALHGWPDDRRVCKASELGFSYARLMRRIGAPFPGHPHHWLAESMGEDASAATGRERDPTPRAQHDGAPGSPGFSPSSEPGCPASRRSAPR